MTHSSEAPRPTAALIAIIILGVLGIADSTYLVSLKVESEVRGYADSQVCTALSESGCEIALQSDAASIGPIPISLVALATYAIVAGLAGLWLSGRLMIFARGALQLISVGAVLWSLFLAWYSYSRGSWCPFCIGLYGINFGLLIASSIAARQNPLAAFGDVFGQSRGLIGAVAALVLLVGGGYLIMKKVITAQAGDRTERDAQRLEQALAAGQFDVDLSGLPTAGPADAPLTVVKLSDFECPHCRKYWDQVEEFRERYPNAIRFVFSNHALSPDCNPMMASPFHANACNAAWASWCGHQQGRFWELADKIFEHQHELSAKNIREYAEDVGLDMSRYDTCLKAPETRAAVEKQALMARAIGAGGTPASLVNGFRFMGGMDVVTLEGLSETLPNRLKQSTPGKAALQKLQDKLLAAGQTTVAPSPRTLPNHVPSDRTPPKFVNPGSNPPFDASLAGQVVAFIDPAKDDDRALLEQAATLALVHPHQYAVGFRILSPAVCATDADDPSCLPARVTACTLVSGSARGALIKLGKTQGDIAPFAQLMRDGSDGFDACLADGGTTDILREDQEAATAAGVDGGSVFVAGYRFGPMMGFEQMDAFIARLALEQRP